jgi:L-ascorbate metabolism protein UlaG (beta-lactamase superfamily)
MRHIIEIMWLNKIHRLSFTTQSDPSIIFHGSIRTKPIINISHKMEVMKLKIRHIRHATSILCINDLKILVDPVLGPKGTYPGIPNVPDQSRNPMTELPVSVDELLSCDMILSTHTHNDHFDVLAKELLPKSIPVLCQPQDEDKLKTAGFTDISPVDRSIEWNGIQFTRTGGRHGHRIIAKRLAPVSGYIIKAPGEPVIYLTGDTVWCPCVEKALTRYKPEVVICFSGEARLHLGKPITMGTQDILEIHKTLPAARIIAVHFGTFNHCRLTRNALREFARTEGFEQQLIIPADGEYVYL